MTKSKYKGVTHKTRVNHLRLALSLAGVRVTDEVVLEIVIRVFDGVEELKGDFTVRDAAKIKADVEALYKKKKTTK